MEWLIAFFAVSGMWIWFWAVVCFAGILYFEENEKNLFAFITVAIFATIMHNSGVITLTLDPLTILGYAALYYVIGGIWSFIKWFSFLNKKADRFGELKLKFIHLYNENMINHYGKDSDKTLTENVRTKVPDELEERFESFLYTEDYFKLGERSDGVIPLAKNYKEKIVTWILWWPFSAFWTLLNDPLVRLANWMYRKFQGGYTLVAQRVFSKFD